MGIYANQARGGFGGQWGGIYGSPMERLGNRFQVRDAWSCPPIGSNMNLTEAGLATFARVVRRLARRTPGQLWAGSMRHCLRPVIIVKSAEFAAQNSLNNHYRLWCQEI